jgi:hypothetical protein
MKSFKEVFSGPYQVNRIFIVMIFILGMFIGSVITAIIITICRGFIIYYRFRNYLIFL